MRVLLVHHDTARLSELAEALRTRGLSVAVATSATMATERAALGEYDAILVSQELSEMTEDGLGLVDALALSLALAPPVVVLAPAESSPTSTEVREDDPAAILARLRDLPPVSRARTSFMSAHFSLHRTPIASLLAAFADERRSGTLSVSSAAPSTSSSLSPVPSSSPSSGLSTGPSRPGRGRDRAIACLSSGQLVDVLYGRHQGEKALARLVGMKDGTTHFTPGDPDVLPRLSEPTSSLLARACERAEALTLLASRFPEPLSRVRYVRSTRIDESDDRGLASRVLGLVRGPTSVTEVLDQLPQPDGEILTALLALEASGHVRRIVASGDRTPLVAPEDLQELRARAIKPNREGAHSSAFAGPVRLVLAGNPTRLLLASELVLRISEATKPDDLPPVLPLPHAVAELRLGEGVSVEILALPLVAAYAPFWPIALAGARAIVALDEEALATLTESCGEVRHRLRAASELVPGWSGSGPEDLAALLRAALESTFA